MHRSRTIWTRCGTVVVETGRLAAKRRRAVARKRAEVVKVAEVAPAHLSLSGELSHLLRGSLGTVLSRQPNRTKAV